MATYKYLKGGIQYGIKVPANYAEKKPVGASSNVPTIQTPFLSPLLSTRVPEVVASGLSNQDTVNST